MNRLQEKVAVVTGGGHGIGAAIARRFCEEGARVVIADVDRKAGEELARDIGATFEAVDVSDYDAVGRLIDTVIHMHGGLDAVVSNAAIFDEGTVEGTTLELWQRVIGVNLAPSYYLAHHAAPHLRRRPGASLIIISSVQALRGFPGNTAYAASKGGLLALVREMAADLAPQVRVNAISPGTIRSHPEHLPPDEEQRWAALHLLGRVGECVEVAHAAVFLASDEASFMTGHNLVVDGGLTAGEGRL